MRKFSMPNDDQLLSDLRALQYESYFHRAEKLEQNGIRTYSQLFALLLDEHADAELRGEACWLLIPLRKKVDGRRAIPILLKLLKAGKYELRRDAMHTLGHFGGKRAAEALIAILENEQIDVVDRFDAIYGLSSISDERIAPVFEHIMFNPQEDVRLRAMTIEWFPRYDGMLDTWIRFLSDTLPDLRFWSAYRMSHIPEDPDTNFDAALAALDRVAAYDHTLPRTWGWHVDREALAGLEHVSSRPFRLEEFGTDDGWLPSYDFRLISPASEYDDFSKQHRRYNPDWFYDALAEPQVELQIDPDWLKAQILQSYPQAKFDVRRPKLQTYALDWHLQIEGKTLLGGLHRDQYALVLSGSADVNYRFAAWYRSIIEPQHKLFIYQWADIGIELTPTITATQIAQAEQDLHESRSAPAVLAKLSQTEANE